MKKPYSQKGVTLVEIMVGMAILVFTTVAILQFYLTCLGLAELSKEETVAQEHLTSMLEAIKCTPFNNIPADFPDGVANGTLANPYSWLVGWYNLTNEEIVVSYVDPATDPLEITATVNWQDKRGATRSKQLITRRTR